MQDPAPTAELEPGSRIGSLELLRRVEVSEGLVRFDARSPAGAGVAVRVQHEPGEPGRDRIATEAAILERLAGRYAPALVASGVDRDRRYLAWEQPATESIIDVADARRAAESPRAALLDLARGAAAAFQFLHAQGIVHGAVRSERLRVDAAGGVTIVDFAAAHIASATLPPPRPCGEPEVDSYLEPGAARSLLTHRPPPSASTGQDLYAVAVLLYRLFTGSPPIDLAGDRDERLRQLLRGPPVSFAARGVAAWPEVEAILIRALRKQPARRFETMAALRRALVSVRV